MRSATAATVRLGSQTPRVEWLPPGSDHPDADAAVELAEAAGLRLDPWQERVLRAGLRRRGDRWAAFECALVCPRQNGKNVLLEARELAGLFLLGERLQIHSAHLADTARESFRRLEETIAGVPWLAREVRHVWRTNGNEGIELRSGQRIRYRTRTRGGGRGFAADLVVFDEAMEFAEDSQQAIMPVVSAQPDPQLWYAASAADQTVHIHCRVLAAIRERALRGDDPSLAYWEWSLDFDHPGQVPDDVLDDPAAWAEANPALGHRISATYVGAERRAFSSGRGFAVERLGVGDWPDLSQASEAVIPLHEWDSLAGSPVEGSRYVLAVDVAPDRSSASIAAATEQGDRVQVEIVDRRPGTGWLPDRVSDLYERHRLPVVMDAAGPAGAVIPLVEQLGVDVRTVTSREYAQACGLLVDLVSSRRLRHTGDPRLREAVASATRRRLGDAWAWSRRDGTDISPLAAVTLAAWGVVSSPVAEVWTAGW